MWGRHMFRFLVVAFLGVSPLGVCGNTFSYVKDKEFVELPVAVKWEKDPVIQVCDTAPVTKDEVELLLAEWEAHGAPKLRVISSKCEEDMPETGYIQIDKWRPDWRAQIKKAHAVTAVWPDSPEAGIIMVPDSNMGILRHELGHIWLHGHASDAGHVLCPYVNCIGSEWGGVKKSFRKGGY